MLPGPPRTSELGLRLVLAGAPLIIAVCMLQTSIIRPMLPVYAAVVDLLAPEFTLQSIDLVPGREPAVRLRANLIEPVQFAGHTVRPLGWQRLRPAGGYQISLSLTGLLQYPTLLLVMVLAWPARLRTLGMRLLLSVPLLVLILSLEAPVTIVAELWSLVRDQADPAAPCYWMMWSRFLMGGGGLLLAGILGASAIALAERLRRAPRAIAFA